MSETSGIASRGSASVAEPAGKAPSTPDAVRLLTLYLLLLVAIPSRLVFAPLGSAGTPAQLVGVMLGLWWVAMAITGRGAHTRTWTSSRVAAVSFLAAVLLSYVAAASRPIDANELRSADFGIISVISWLAVFFVAYDHISSRAQLDVFLRRLVFAGGALATLGICQFIFKQPFTNYIQIPGLTVSSTLDSVGNRSGFARPAGTALHPIEFGAVLTMILPIAIHFAMTDRARPALRRWYPVAAIGAAVPISISRSAIVSSAVVLIILMPSWDKHIRRRAYAALIALAGLLYMLVPGLLGTLTSLFTGISGDSSALSRTDSYGTAFELIGKSPIIGRGFFTFLPSYRILDNQWLLLTIELGAVGVLALIAVFWTSIATSIRTRRAAQNVADRSLALALIASIASVALSFALFDAFSFPMVPGMMFLILGCMGAHSRLAERERRVSAEAAPA